LIGLLLALTLKKPQQFVGLRVYHSMQKLQMGNRLCSNSKRNRSSFLTPTLHCRIVLTQFNLRPSISSPAIDLLSRCQQTYRRRFSASVASGVPNN
jgi:hypothetical protein